MVGGGKSCWPMQGPIHTRHEHANLQEIPLLLLASSVNTAIHNSRFHLLAFAPGVQCGLVLLCVGWKGAFTFIASLTFKLQITRNDPGLLWVYEPISVCVGGGGGDFAPTLLCTISCFLFTSCAFVERWDNQKSPPPVLQCAGLNGPQASGAPPTQI